MNGTEPPLDRPTRMRIDAARCQQGRLCQLLAPEIERDRPIAVTSATLEAMAACPTGALGWDESEPSPKAADDDADG